VLGCNIFLENSLDTSHKQRISQNNSAFTKTKLLKLQPCITTIVGWQVTQASLVVCRLLVKKPEGKRRPRHRWEDNIVVDKSGEFLSF